MEPTYKKKILILGSLCLAFLGLIFALSFLGQKKIVQKKAYGAAILSLSSSVASPAVGQDFWVEARVNTNEKVTMFDLVINYNKDVVEVMPAGASDAHLNPLYDCQTIKTDDDNGKIIFQGTIKKSVCEIGSFEDNPQDRVTGYLFLVEFKVKGKIAGNPGIVFGNPIVIYGYNPEQADTIITITEKRPLNITIGAGGPTATGAPVTPTPEPCTHNAWDNNRCRRCNVARGDGWVWSPDCSDFGRWGNSVPTPYLPDPGASVATWCACQRRCQPAATPPPACPTLIPTPTATGAPVTPTPASCSTQNAWDSVNCRRCNVPRGDGWVWSPDCSDYGTWGPTPTPSDPGASVATWCACQRRCQPAATPPAACPTLTPAPTATPTAGACPRGELGNLDCSAAGEIGAQDRDILVKCWGTVCPTLTACQIKAPACRRLPNIIILPSTSATRVDIWDLDKLIRSWGAPPTRP